MPSTNEHTIFITMGSHCDLFWMGTHAECLERGVQIQRHALDLMEEHPDYCYYIETTIFAEYHLRTFPEDRVRMQRLIERGQLEIGACFVDRIEHSHHGESIIRHAVEGLRWLDTTFGAAPRTATHPDLPGMSPQVPQIYAQAGISCYLRARGFGAVYDWTAPDGSSILYCNLFGYSGKDLSQFESILGSRNLPGAFLVRGGYNDLSDASSDVLAIVATLRQRHANDSFLIASPGRVLDRLRSQPLPKLGGEMPFGWGSVSSAFVDAMRQSAELEHRLLTAEKLAALARGLHAPVTPARVEDPAGPSREWLGLHRLHGDIFGDQIAEGDELRQLWRYELLCQDHNYGGYHGAQSNWDREVIREHALAESKRWVEGGVRALAASSPEERLAVFNPLSWPRNDLITIPDSAPETLEVVGPDGSLLPAQPADGGLAVQLAAIPPLTVQTLALRRGQTVCVPLLGDTLRGDTLEMSIDLEKAQITRLSDRVSGCDLIAHDGERRFGELVSYKDPGVDVRYGFTGEIESDAGSGYNVECREDGPVFSRIVMAGTFLNSRVEKEFRVYKSLRRADVLLRVWWWGKRGEHLRLCFPFAGEDFTETWYGVPFYAMRWPEMLHGDGVADDLTLYQGGESTDMLSPADRRHFREVIGWLDVGYAHHGVTVGTRSTCWWINGPELHASLLRTQFSCGDARLWNLNAGFHEWEFHIEPHEGDWRAGKAYRKGEESLNRVEAFRLAAQATPGPLNAPCQPPRISPDNVVMTTMKPSDVEPDAVLVRVLECEGRPAAVTLALPFGIRRAELVDLMERPAGAALPQGSVITFSLRPYQFQTVRIWPR